MRHRRTHRRGMGMVELLMSLVIVAGLLAATAAALVASFDAYAANQEQAGLMQQARLAVARIAFSIARSEAHAPGDGSLMGAFAEGQTVSGNSIAMFDPDGAEIRYAYDADAGTVTMQIGGESHVVARGVTAFEVRMEPMRSEQSARVAGAWDLLRRATVRITVRSTQGDYGTEETTGNQTITLSAAVAPRRNVW